MEDMHQEDTQLVGSPEVDNHEGGILLQGDTLQEVEDMHQDGILHDHGVKRDPFHHAYACPFPCFLNQKSVL